MKKYLTLLLFFSLSYFVNAQTNPTTLNNTVNTNEDNDLVFVAGDFPYTDIDGDAFNRIRITGLEIVGILYYDADNDNNIDPGEDVLLNQEILVADIPRLKFRPVADAFGAGYDSFNFEVHDGNDGFSATSTMTIDIIAVNDEPSFTGGANQTVIEDAGIQTVINWATAIVLGPANEVPPQTATFVVSNDNNSLFVVQPAINAAGDLTYTTAVDASGLANVTVSLTDGGGIANGGDDTSGPPNQNFTITVTTVNDAPTSADNTLNCYENSYLTFALPHFNYADVEGNPMTQIEISSVPVPGTLWEDTDNDGIVDGGEYIYVPGDVVTTADINLNRLKFRPLNDENNSPYTGLNFRVFDGTDYSINYTMTINVLAVNSEPFFTEGADQAVNEEAGAQTIAGWAAGISQGTGDPAQVLTFNFINPTPALFTGGGQPDVDEGTGNLTFTPAPDANGFVDIEIWLTDNGGTANGGDDRSGPPNQTFRITINPINDPLTLVTNNPLNINEGDLNTIIPTGLLEITDIDNTTSEIVYTLAALPGSGSLYSGGSLLLMGGTFTQADIDGNAITYSHDGSEGAADSFTFTASDGAGGTVGATVFNINVAPLNDSPVFTSPTVNSGDIGVLYTYNITTNDPDGDPVTISPVLVPAWLVLTDNGDGTATLTGTPPGGTPLNNSIIISVSDGMAPAVNQSWNLIISSTAAPNAGLDDEACTNDSHTLTGNAPPVGYTGFWTVIRGNGIFTNSTDPGTDVSDLNSGPAPNNINEFRWSFTNGPDTVYNDVIILNNTVNASVVPMPGDICTDITTINAMPLNPDETGFWTHVGAAVPVPVITNPNNITTGVSGLNYNLNQFRWTVSKGGCSDDAVLDVINNSVTIPDAGVDQVLCSNTTKLAANNPTYGTGQWTVSGANQTIIVTPTAFNTTLINIPPATLGSVVLTWTITKGICSLDNDVNISNVSVTADAGADKSVCINPVDYFLQGNDPTLQSVTGYNATGTWTNASMPPVIIDDIVAYNSGFSNLLADDNLFRWTITNGTCSDYDDVIITNDVPQEIPEAGDNQTLCSTTTNLAGNSPSIGSGINTRWVVFAGGAIISNSTSNKPSVTDLEYYVENAGPNYWQTVRTINQFRWVYEKNGCEIWDEVGVINSLPRPADAGDDQQVCWNEANLNAVDLGSGSMESYWTQGDGCAALPSNSATIIGPNEFNAHVQNIQSGITTFRWHKWVRINCSGQASECLPPVLCNAGRPNGVEPGFPPAQCTLYDDVIITRVGGQIGRAQAGTNQIVCSQDAELNASEIGDVFDTSLGHVLTSHWETIQGTGVYDNSASNNTWVRGLSPTDNQASQNILRWTITNNTLGCIATSDVIVANGLPSTPTVGPVLDVCVPTALVSATPPTLGTGTWTVTNGDGTLSNASCNQWNCNVTVSGITPGNTPNVLTWTVNRITTVYDVFDGSTIDNSPAGCPLSDEVTFYNNGITALAGNDTTICFDSFQLEATPPGDGATGTWTTSGSGIFATPTLYNSFVTSLNADLNTLVWTVTKGNCTSIDQVQIINNKPDDPIASAPSLDICFDFTSLNGNAPIFNMGDGAWSVKSGGATIANSLLNPNNATGMGLGPNTFTWTITKNGCSLSDDVTVNNNSVVAEAGDDDPRLCGTEAAGYTTSLLAVEPSQILGWTGLWTVDIGPGIFTDATAYDSDVYFPGGANRTGLKRFTWTVSGPNGANPRCTASDAVEVDVYVPTTANAGNDEEICFDKTGILYLNGNVAVYGTGLWKQTGTGLLVPNFITPTSNTSGVTNLGYNETNLQWTIDNNGCTSLDTMAVSSNYVYADAGSDEDICVTTYTLDGNDPKGFGESSYGYASGLWSRVNATGTFTEQTLYNTDISGLRLSPLPDNTLRWTITKGTCPSVSDDVVITNNAVTAEAGNVIYTCDDFIPNLDGNDVGLLGGSGVWIWTNASNVVQPTLYRSRVENLQSGLNSYTWNVTSGAGGCTDDDIVEVYNHGVSAFAGFDIETCEPFDTVTATLPTKGIGAWSRFNGNPVVFDNSLLSKAEVSGLVSGSYTLRWTVTYTDPNITCEAFDDMVLLNSSILSVLASTPDDETCGEDGQLQGTIPVYISGETGIWSGGGAGSIIADPTANNTTVSNLPLGPNTFTWTLTNGVNITCTDSDDVTIANNSVVADAGTDKDAENCNDFTTLLANDLNLTQGNGEWTDVSVGPSSAFIVEPSVYNTQVTNLRQGETTFRWTVTQGTCPTAVDEVVITNNNVYATVGPNQTSCSDTYGPLSGNNPLLQVNAEGEWSTTVPGVIFVQKSIYNTTVQNLQPGSNTLRWTVNSTVDVCNDFDEITITNNMVAAYAGSDQTDLCQNYTKLNATATNAVYPFQGTGVWSVGGSSSAIIDNTASNTPNVSNLNPNVNNFNWTVSLGNCQVTDVVSVYNYAVTATATDVESCYDYADLTGNDPGPGENGVWFSYSPGITYTQGSTVYNTEVGGLSSGNNTFIWTVSNGVCKDDANINVEYIEVIPSPGSEQNLCRDYTDLAAKGTGVWTVQTGGCDFSSTTDNNAQITNLLPGQNVLEWTVTKKICSETATVTINNNLPDVSVGPDRNTCFDNVILQGNEPGTDESGVWTQTANFAAIITNSTLYNSDVTNLSGGVSIFKWTISNAACFGADAASIEVAIRYNEIIPEAGDPITSCDGTAKLLANKPINGNGVWSAGIGAGIFDNSLEHDTRVTGLDIGLNTLTWTVGYNGCFKSDDVEIINNQIFVEAGDPQPLCSDWTLMNGNVYGAGQEGLWSTPGSARIVTPSDRNSMVTDLTQGTNTFIWTITDLATGCAESDQVVISNNEVPDADVNAGFSKSVCSPNTKLSALAPPDPGESGAWTDMASNVIFDDSTDPTTDIRNLSKGDNTLIWTVTKGICPKSESIIITNNAPTTANTATDEEICSSTFLANANSYGAGETGLWTNGLGSVGNIETPTSNITNITDIGLGANVFTWTISNANCNGVNASSNDIVITNSSITTDAGLDQPICNTDETGLSADNPAPGTGVWTVVSSAGGIPIFDNSADFGTDVRNLAQGANIFMWTATKGICPASDIVTITNITPTQADAGKDTTVCDGTIALRGNNPFPFTGVWTRIGGSSLTNIVNPSYYNTDVTDLGKGTTRFIWTIRNGTCESTDDVSVTNDVIFVSAGLADEVCSDTYPELQGNPLQVGQKGEWTESGGEGTFTDPTLYNSEVTDIGPNENIYTWTITRGTCSNSADVTITNNSPTTASVSPDDPDLCYDYKLITGTPEGIGETGYWEKYGGSGIFDNSLNNSTTVREIGLGLNQYKWTIVKGKCESFAVINVTNKSVSAIVGVDRSSCGPIDILVAVEPDINKGESGLWSTLGGAFIQDPTKADSDVSNLVVGENNFRWSVTNGSCSDDATFVIENDKYEVTADIAGPNIICKDEADLIGNILIGGCTGLWTIPGGDGEFEDDRSPTTKVSGLSRNESRIRWTISKNGCDNFAEVAVINHMVEAYAGKDIITCGEDPTIVATPTLDHETGFWDRITGTGLIDNSLSNVTDVTNLSDGANIYRWYVDGKSGCFDFDDVTVFENSFTTSAGLPEEICTPTYVLQGADPAPGTGLWTFSGPGVTIDDQTSNVTTVRGLQDDSDYIFTWNVERNGCTDSKYVTITNNYIQAYAGSDQSVCEGEATLNADDPLPGTGLWTITSGGGTLSHQGTYYGADVTGLVPGTTTLQWTLMHENCPSISNVTVTNNHVSAVAGTEQNICFDNTLLAGTPEKSGGSGIWTKQGSGQIENETLYNTQVTNLQQGANVFTWTVYENGCNNIGHPDTRVTINNNSFFADAGNDEILDPYVIATNFTASLPDATATGLWSVSAGQGDVVTPDHPTSNVIDMQTGVNVFEWYVQYNGCFDSDFVAFTVRDFIPFAGDDKSICADTVILQADGANIGNNHFWTRMLGSGDFDDRNSPTTTVRNIQPGDNVYRWTVIRNGYTAFDDVVITNNSFEIYAGEDDAICEREYLLQADHPGMFGTGLWTVEGLSSGGVFENPTYFNTRVTGLNPGLNYFRWHVERDGCEDSDTVAISWTRPPVAQFIADPAGFCAPDTVVFTNTSYSYPEQTSADIFKWSSGDDYLGTTNSVTELMTNMYDNTGLTDEVHTVQLIAIDAETQCSDTFTSDINVYARPQVNFYPIPSTVNFADGSTIRFENDSEEGYPQYIWDFGDGDSQIDISHTGVVPHRYGTWGKYYVTLTAQTANGCEYSHLDSILIIPPCPVSHFSNGNNDGCEPLTHNFSASTLYAESYYWDFGDGQTSTEENPIHVYENPGVYYPTLTASGQECNNTFIREDTITVYAKPTAIFSYDPKRVVTHQEIHYYNYSTGANRYEWNLGDITLYDESPVHSYSEAGTYDILLFAWNDIEGHSCMDSTSISNAVIVEEPGLVKFPDAFTPSLVGQNGGEYPCNEFISQDLHDNNVFFPFNRGVGDEYKLEIYNRWGEKIFESYDICIGWDGYVRGVLSPQDVYVWKVTGRFKNGTPFMQAGNVTLLR